MRNMKKEIKEETSIIYRIGTNYARLSFKGHLPTKESKDMIKRNFKEFCIDKLMMDDSGRLRMYIA